MNELQRFKEICSRRCREAEEVVTLPARYPGGYGYGRGYGPK
jgi:hypothetical protein